MEGLYRVGTWFQDKEYHCTAHVVVGEVSTSAFCSLGSGNFSGASRGDRWRCEVHEPTRNLYIFGSSFVQFGLPFEPLHSKSNLVYCARSRWQSVLAHLLSNVPCLPPSSPICSFPVASSFGILLPHVTIGLSSLSKPGLCFLPFRIEHIRFPVTLGGTNPSSLTGEMHDLFFNPINVSISSPELIPDQGTWCPAGNGDQTPGIGTTGGQYDFECGPRSKLEQKVSLPTIFGFENHRTEPLLLALIRLHRPCTPLPARTR
ncbi:hypothetical protein TIFTF001_026490 [Ficus carica]|uniref:Uncharacterized protein n=1 Tax=Ficus carica TaxID=3494 RepID=A0AA88DL88_FICCA|nr:hypothetical protein TIFTF001_026490 [Ficus carica]